MFNWNAHRFSGGALALDLANTIVWSDVPDKRIDRFEDRAEIAAFADAASQFRRDELGGLKLVAPSHDLDIRHLLHLRKTVDAWLRPQILGADTTVSLSLVFAACAKASAADVEDAACISLGEATSRSVTRFIADATRTRLKSCPNCRWLYLDNSKNQSRQWCDMKVCGNRAKVRAFHARHKLFTLSAENAHALHRTSERVE